MVQPNQQIPNDLQPPSIISYPQLPANIPIQNLASNPYLAPFYPPPPNMIQMAAIPPNIVQNTLPQDDLPDVMMYEGTQEEVAKKVEYIFTKKRLEDLLKKYGLKYTGGNKTILAKRLAEHIVNHRTERFKNR